MLMKNIALIPFAVGYFLFSICSLIVLLFIPKKRFHKIYRNLDREEVRQRIDFMKHHVSNGSTLLDVGSGNGLFGKTLQDELGVEVQGVDVVNYAEPYIPVHIYDGKKLPFPDKSFDVVCVAFVLHHCKDQEGIFSELVRVARKKIIVFEDSYYTKIQRWFTMWNDFQTNILQGGIKALKGYAKPDIVKMPIPFTFRSVHEWRSFFKGFGMKEDDFSERHSKYKPLTKVTFSLGVPDPS